MNKLKTLFTATYLMAALTLTLYANTYREPELLQPEEKDVINSQSKQFNQVISPKLQEASLSTVRIWNGKNMLSYGTVVSDGTKVITKWSSIAHSTNKYLLSIGSGASKDDVRVGSVIGVYPQDDLALLAIEGKPLKPIQWHQEKLPLGSFVVAVQPDGVSAGIGVISVLERNLAPQNDAFLGVMIKPSDNKKNIIIDSVTPQSPAEKAGILPRDVMISLNGKAISSPYELQVQMKQYRPNDSVQIICKRNQKEISMKVVLEPRPQIKEFSNRNLMMMEQLGTRINAVRNNFPNAVQTDMRINPEQMGGPIVDLEGRAIGVTLARGDRTKTYFISSKSLLNLLETKPQDPSAAQLNTEPADVVSALQYQKNPSQGFAPQAPSQPRPRITQEEMLQRSRQMDDIINLMRREMKSHESR